MRQLPAHIGDGQWITDLAYRWIALVMRGNTYVTVESAARELDCDEADVLRVLAELKRKHIFEGPAEVMP